MGKFNGNQIKSFMTALIVPAPIAQFPSRICTAERMEKKTPFGSETLVSLPVFISVAVPGRQ